MKYYKWFIPPLAAIPACLFPARAWADPFEPGGTGAVLLGGWALVCILAVCVAALYSRLRTVREQGGRFRHMVESSNSVVMRIAADGTIRYANRRAFELFGYGPGELEGANVSMLIPDSDQSGADLSGLWERVVAGAVPMEGNENENLCKDGRRVHMAWTNKLLRNAAGEVEEVLSIGSNVTQARRQQGRLQRLELALDQATDGVVIADLGGVVEYANQAWIRQHGFETQAGILGITLPFFNPEHSLNEAMRRLARRVQTLGRAEGEVRCPVRGGGEMDCWLSAAMVREAGGEPVGYVGVFRDISRQKLMEAEIRESEERFSQLVGAIEEAFWLRSHDHLLYLSPNYERIFRCTVESDMHDPMALFRCVHPEDRELLEEAFSAPAYADEGRLDVEVRIRPEEGGERWIRARSYPLYRDDELYRIAGIAEDVTRYKEIEARLRDARDAAEVAARTKSMILSNVTHEIRTPLNGVLGMLQILQMAGLDGENAEHVDTAMASARKLSGLFDAIMRYSELDSGTRKLDEHPFSLSNLLEGLVRSHLPAAREKGLELTTSIAIGTRDELLGDGAKLREVLDILVGNAIKFTMEGSVVVSASTGPGSRSGYLDLGLSVTDTGVGIPEDRLPLVLDGFVQAEQTYSRRFGGLGIGLGMARRMMEMLGGALMVESVHGEGTAVHVGLEVRPADGARR